MLDVILERLDKVKKQGDQYYAKCPVHMGSKQNLGITEKDGKIIMHCFACNAKGVEVCDAIGLPVHVLFKDDPTTRHDLTLSFSTSLTDILINYQTCNCYRLSTVYGSYLLRIVGLDDRLRFCNDQHGTGLCDDGCMICKDLCYHDS